MKIYLVNLFSRSIIPMTKFYRIISYMINTFIDEFFYSQTLHLIDLGYIVISPRFTYFRFHICHKFPALPDKEDKMRLLITLQQRYTLA